MLFLGACLQEIDECPGSGRQQSRGRQGVHGCRAALSVRQNPHQATCPNIRACGDFRQQRNPHALYRQPLQKPYAVRAVHAGCHHFHTTIGFLRGRRLSPCLTPQASLSAGAYSGRRVTRIFIQHPAVHPLKAQAVPVHQFIQRGRRSIPLQISR